MSTKHAYLRLKIPSLSQANEGNYAASQEWCGRTAGSMIYNYYLAAQKQGGLADVKGEVIHNQRDKAPFDLVFRGGACANQVAIRGFSLLTAVSTLKKGWKSATLFPKDDPARKEILAGEPLSEGQVIQRLAILLQALDLFNPVLIRTGLSNTDGGPGKTVVRHLVVVSGYRQDADGSLWLHIDDPSSRAYDEHGKLRPLPLEATIERTRLMGITDAVQQLEPDTTIDDRPGRRYWLRAAVLFQPNLHSVGATDFWCDHSDSPGLEVDYTHEPQPFGSMVELSGDPRYPVSVVAEGGPALWDAVARSGDPYPLSFRRWWHNGIHIPRTDGVTRNLLVHPIAPGRAVIAWFPKRVEGQPDRGMVVMRHALDLASLRFVDAREDTPPEGAIWVHTLYANLDGGKRGASRLLARLKPEGEKPKLANIAAVGTPIRLLTATGAMLQLATHEGLRKALTEDQLVKVDDPACFALRPTPSVVGVQLTGHPWVLDGDVVKVKADFAGKTGRLFRAIKGTGASRSFPEQKLGRDYVDVTIDADTTLRHVEVFRSNGLDRALVEVREVVDAPDNQDAIDEWERRDKLYREALDKLCGAEYAMLDDFDPTCRDFVEEPIGTMGVQIDGVTGKKIGVHVEVFAKENFAAKAHAGGRWAVLEEALGEPYGTRTFFEQQVDALLSTARNRAATAAARTSDPSLVGPAGDAQLTTLLSLVHDRHPVSIMEWVEHCAVPQHARELSQVVAKHRSEWTLDVVEDDSNRISLSAMPAALKQHLFPAQLDSPGLDTDTFFYFHPLRIVEWLRTGIDVSLHDLPEGKRDNVKLVLSLGDTKVHLVRFGDDPNYRLRLVLGDGADASELMSRAPAANMSEQPRRESDWVSRGVLELEGIATKNPEIEVELRRDKVVSLSFTEPGGHADTLREIGSRAFGIAFDNGGIVLAKGEEKFVHLLQDAGGPLDDLACGKATFLLEVRYNVALPDRLALTVPPGFMVESLEVSGATIDPPPAGAASYADLRLVRTPDPDDDGADELITSAGTVIVKATLVPASSTAMNAAASSTTTKASVEIEVSGGDLEAPVKGKWEIRQRDIPQKASGHDVAKLQVYLSQILCGAFGCLRGRNRSPVARIDGDYGEATSLALWRFLLHYEPKQKVSTKSGDVELDGVSRSEAEIETMAAELHKKHGGPKVTKALLDVIVSYYRLPYIGVACSIGVVIPAVALAVAGLSQQWGGWNSVQRTRVLPLPEAAPLQLNVRVKVVVPGDLAAVNVSVALEDGSAYRLIGSVPTTLAALVAQGLELAPSGELNAAKAKPRLVVKAASGGQLAAIDLGGATDVRAAGTEVGFDALMIQHWLGQRMNSKGKPYLAGPADGKFADGSKSALDAFVADRNAKRSKYPEIVRWLQTGVAPAEQEAAQ